MVTSGYIVLLLECMCPMVTSGCIVLVCVSPPPPQCAVSRPCLQMFGFRASPVVSWEQLCGVSFCLRLIVLSEIPCDIASWAVLAITHTHTHTQGNAFPFCFYWTACVQAWCDITMVLLGLLDYVWEHNEGNFHKGLGVWKVFSACLHSNYSYMLAFALAGMR